jgi:hypothetical protein
VLVCILRHHVTHGHVLSDRLDRVNVVAGGFGQARQDVVFPIFDSAQFELHPKVTVTFVIPSV